MGVAATYANGTARAGETMSERVSEPHDPVSARIRNLVIDRILRMNARHATFAWLQRRVQPIGPHGLAFFYCEEVRSSDREVRHRVAAATRLVDDGEDVRDLPRLLYRLSTLARDRYVPGSGGFNPLVHMTNRHDPMSTSAFYVGVGVSSLDTVAASWDDVQRTATGPLDVPGRCFLQLRDGSAMLLERGAQDVYRQVRILSTHDLNVDLGISTRRWAWRPDLRLVEGDEEIWRQLNDLHLAALPPWSQHRGAGPT